MICGNCKSDHATVADVKACYAGGKLVSNEAPAISHSLTPVERFNALAERLCPGDSVRYAIDTPDHPTREWQAYQVDRPATGTWAGRTFVKVCSSDDTHRIPFGAQLSVLEAIVAAGPESALAEYGHRVGKCGVCHRTLTDPESISLGIGPICRAKW